MFDWHQIDLLLARLGTKCLLGEAITFYSPCLIMVCYCASLLAFVKKLGYDDIKGDLDDVSDDPRRHNSFISFFYFFIIY